MSEELLYSGEISEEVYDEVSEAVEGFSTEWINAEVDLILEGEEDSLRVEGPETVNLFKPWKTHRPSDTYGLDDSAERYLRQAFE